MYLCNNYFFRIYYEQGSHKINEDVLWVLGLKICHKMFQITHVQMYL